MLNAPIATHTNARARNEPVPNVVRWQRATRLFSCHVLLINARTTTASTIPNMHRPNVSDLTNSRFSVAPATRKIYGSVVELISAPRPGRCTTSSSAGPTSTGSNFSAHASPLSTLLLVCSERFFEDEDDDVERLFEAN